MSRLRRPARIRIDAGPLLQGRGRARGLAYVIVALLDGLARLPEAPETVLVDPVRGREHPAPAAGALEPVPAAFSTEHRAGVLAYQAAQTLHYRLHPTGPGEVTLFMAHHALPFVLPERSAVVVHDLIASAWGPWADRRKLGALRDRLLAWRLAGATHLMTGSEAARRDMARVLGVDPARVSVVLDAVLAPGPVGDPPSPRLAALAGRRPCFLLWLGAREPRKGLRELLAAWGARPPGGVALVVAGLGKAYDDATEAELRRALAGRPDVEAVEDLAEAEKSWLLARAAALVYPSRYEGFGLPLAEAMAVGTPAASFDNSSLPEVVGDAGVLVPDGRFDELLAAGLALAGDPARRGELAKRCRVRAARFTTEAMARGYLEALGRVALA